MLVQEVLVHKDLGASGDSALSIRRLVYYYSGFHFLGEVREEVGGEEK